jgi:hypothetical protein
MIRIERIFRKFRTLFSPREKISHNSLRYSGRMDQDCVPEFIDLLSKVLESSKTERKEWRRICRFAIELLDNGIRYSIDSKLSFSWDVHGDSITFELKNDAREIDAFRLKSHVEKLLSLDREELKTSYIEHLSESEFGEKGGAGLGLLYMFRKGITDIDIQIENNGDGSFSCTSRITAPFPVIE